MKPRLESIRYDVSILRTLRNPSTVYDVKRNSGYAYSSVHKLVKEYNAKGIVSVIREEKTRVNSLTKKYYQLTDLGHRLLNLIEDLDKA